MSLTGASNNRVKTYSGGMRRRLDVAASLIGRPPVLFLDEPTTGLDPRTRNDLWRFVEELVAEGTTVLLTTQYMEEAEHLANGIVVMDAGRVVAQGTADELKDRLGGNVLEIRVTNRADLERAASLVAGLGDVHPRCDSELNRVSLPINDGARALIAAGRTLDDSGIALDDIGIRRPSLDDVFLALTGHATGGDNTTDTPGTGGTDG
jgi:ABC-type multidrug transport system ATPase subunit